MRPGLVPGEEVVATGSLRARRGDVVVFAHPDRDDFWLIKRVARPPGSIPEGHLWVVSDNTEATTADSRTFGSIRDEDVLVVVDRFDDTRFEEACHLLAGEDAALAEAIERYGVPTFWHREPGIKSLALLILEQQVSLESGAAVYRRLDQATGGISAGSLLDLGIEGMRDIGTTRQKASYLKGLAESIEGGRFDIDQLGHIPWQEARERLISLKGIGPWTADAYLLSALRIPDMWPIGDRALQVGVGELLGMNSSPSEKDLELIGEPWRPIRAAAARIIWNSYLAVRGRVEPSQSHAVPDLA
jgi:DNA-3-methyladenine glycosylase II